MSADDTKKPRFDLSKAILAGMVAGVACGVFFGEYCAPLGVVGDLYIGLLQMTVLPYIVLALIVNIGGLAVGSAKTMARWATGTMLLLWGVTLAAVFLMPLALPEWRSGSFFSSSLVEERETLDFLELFVPVNPFESLAQSVIPAVVLFCIVVGAALIGAGNSAVLLEPLRVMLDALGKVTRWVAKLTPIGVFALSAKAAGTLTVSEFARLQGYVILYITTALLLTVVVLPGLVASLTPFSRREVLSVSKDALITALATDNVFVVLPLLIENAKELFHRHSLASEETDRDVEAALPLAFPFPNAGRLLAMIFIPFGAWFTGRALELWDYPVLAVAGVSSLFAKVTVALPFLLDIAQLPADLFNLFLLAGVVAGPFNSLVGAMHLLAFSLITTAGMNGLVRVDPRRLLVQAVPSVVVGAVSILAIHAYLGPQMQRAGEEGNILARMTMLSDPVVATVLAEPSFETPRRSEGLSALDQIREEGVLRVAFSDQSLPFTFFNAAGDLVGYDVEMAHLLAADLGVELVFNPADADRAEEQLESGAIDLVMSGTEATPGRLARFPFTESYLDVSPALVVTDHDRARFDSLEEVLEEGVGLAVADEPLMVEFVARQLPEATVIPIEDRRDFFEGRVEGALALFESAESGSAWTMIYPGHHVVTPWKEFPKWPLGYIVASGDHELREFLNRWIDLQRREGTLRRLYDHWILGLTAAPEAPRWSVIRDVLHWVE